MAVNRCVAIISRFHRDGRSPTAADLMAGEIQIVAAWALDMEVDPGVLERQILRPVEDRLYTQYGHELAPRLFKECLKAFEDLYAEGLDLGLIERPNRP